MVNHWHFHENQYISPVRSFLADRICFISLFWCSILSSISLISVSAELFMQTNRFWKFTPNVIAYSLVFQAYHIHLRISVGCVCACVSCCRHSPICLSLPLYQFLFFIFLDLDLWLETLTKRKKRLADLKPGHDICHDYYASKIICGDIRLPLMFVIF